MAKEIVWDSLTPIEAETLAALKRSGTEVFAAPIEIKHKGQLESLGITWAQCRTWYIGSDPITVHLTPADKATYKFLLGELRTKHRKKHRKNRCPVPGKLKPLIPCPECNKCSECPFPEYRDKHLANQVSYEQMLADGTEVSDNSRFIEKLEAKMQYEEIREIMNKEDPLIAQVLEMKVRDYMAVKDIADDLGLTERQVYHYLSKAKAIGKEYNSN